MFFSFDLLYDEERYQQRWEYISFISKTNHIVDTKEQFKNIKEAQTKVRYPYKRNEYSVLEAWHLIHAVLSSLFH